MNHRLFFLPYFFLLPVLVFIACDQRKTKPDSPIKEDTVLMANKVKDTLSADPVAVTIAPYKITYHYLPLDSVLITTLKKRYTEDQLNIVLAVNRIDFEHVWKADTLVVPDTFLYDFNSYAPFPDTINILEPIEKMILISYGAQAFAVYEKGKLIRWGPTSMGKRSTPTPTGLFHANWKAKQTISTENPEWKLNWYVNLDNKRGVSLHEYDLPGFPASHACIRLYEHDAHWFYDYINQWILIDDYSIAAYGTPVIIFGKYAFGKRKPWLDLPTNGDAIKHHREELENELMPFIPTLLLRAAARDSVLLSKINPAVSAM